MNPTTYELAKLAAMLPTGKPSDRVKTAVEIWNHAETHLFTQRLEKLESAPAVWTELPTLLAELMPKKSKADREGAWLEFLASASDAESAVATLAAHHEKGVIHLEKIIPAFKTWADGVKAKNLSERGSKGGRGKQSKAKGGLETAGKTTKTKKVLDGVKSPASNQSAPASNQSAPTGTKWVSRKHRPTMR